MKFTKFPGILFLQDTFDGCFCTYSLSTCRYLFIYLFIHLFIYLFIYRRLQF